MRLVCVFPGNHLFIAYWTAFSFYPEETELVMYSCFHQERKEKAEVPLGRDWFLAHLSNSFLIIITFIFGKGMDSDAYGLYMY